MNKVLIDTNILIYALDKKSTLNTEAVSILKRKDLLLYITSKNVSEYFAVCTKLKIDPSLILGFYEEIKINTILLFPDHYSISIFESLFIKYKPKGNQIFDLEIVSIMLANEIKTIATFNYKDFVAISEIKFLPTT